MADTVMDSSSTGRSPASLWIVGGLSLLWNLFGAFDYVMTRMRNEDYLANMGDPSRILAYLDSYPLWVGFGWGLGVWAALSGSILLLMRSRWAVTCFAASLIGMVLSLPYQYFGAPPPPEMTAGFAKYMPVVIILIGVALFLYARSLQAKGVLK